MSLHLNGTGDPAALLTSTGMSADALAANLRRHVERTDKRLADGTDYFARKDGIAHPSQMGAAMLLEQRTTPAYADTVGRATITRRRAANKAARRARRAHR